MGKGFLKKMIGYILFLTLASLPLFAEDGTIMIGIDENVTVGEGRVYLSEIASLQGATPDEKRLLDTLDLGKAPAAGKSRGMTRQYISYKLAQAGFKGERIELEMPDQVKVTGAGRQLTPEILHGLIEDSIRSKVPELWTSWQMEFNGGFNNRWVPPGELSAEIDDSPDTLEPGTNLLQVRVLADRKVALRLAVAVRIDATGRVPILQSDLEKHSRLSASSITWEERPLQGREALVLKEEDLRTTRRLQKGEVINRADVERAPLVNKGDKVQIIYQSDGASVMVYGLARNDGWLGQTINVENIDSKKAISGIVVAEGRVEVK